MPKYSYKCAQCGSTVVKIAPPSQVKPVAECDCGALAERELAVNFVLKGDAWAGKNLTLLKQMNDKNARLDRKQEEKKRDLKGMMRLAPNVGGERVDSWSEAAKLAASRGKDTSSYEPMVRKEKAGEI